MRALQGAFTVAVRWAEVLFLALLPFVCIAYCEVAHEAQRLSQARHLPTDCDSAAQQHFPLVAEAQHVFQALATIALPLCFVAFAQRAVRLAASPRLHFAFAESIRPPTPPPRA
ncbi:MAG: hypothetical protein NZL91_03225 [Thermoflexales bacterium]|nr:hypothetical protein [Thermoflexales bacterium]MDW8292955.1 hypothetical protein [Anaerolineae bacterium]